MKRKKFLALTMFSTAWLMGASAFAWDEPTLEGDVYQIGTASELEWFSEHVAVGGANALAKAVLTADLDFTGIDHKPIGQDQEKKYNGVFDGQGHRIKNLVAEGKTTDYGFFGWVRGGTVIKNLIIDSSCSFSTSGRSAALIAITQAKAGGVIEVENVVNMANVTSTGSVAASMLAAGAPNNDHPVINFTNCVNTGTIKGADNNKGAAFIGWNNSATNSTIKNSYNIGEASPLEGTNNMFRGSFRAFVNAYDFANTTAQGKTGTQCLKTDWITADPVHSGELCYLLNERGASTVFKQDLSDPTSIPMPVSTGELVYQIATYRCDGTPAGEVTYTNEEAEQVIPPHTFSDETGMCTVCGHINDAWRSQQEDGFYHLRTTNELIWFSAMVNKAGGSALNAKLENDIDMEGITYTPIGFNDANKFQGTFDGQGHRILNLKAFSQTSGVGVFGMLRGGSVVKNLIVDSSCDIRGTQWVGAIAGGSQVKGTGYITIENCINYAPVHVERNIAAGIFGQNRSGDLGVIIRNCGNAGQVSTTASNACGLVGWTGSNASTEVIIENCWNVGEVIKGGWDKSNNDGHAVSCEHLNLFNYPEASAAMIKVINTYDASATALKTQGTTLSEAAAGSGELTAKLGGAWRQTIGDDAAPVLDNTHGIVAGIGEAQYSTLYIGTTDVTVPTGVEAFTGTIDGDVLKLTKVDDINKEDAVVLKGNAGYYSFMPTTGITKVADNDLKGSEGFNATGVEYCLAKLDDAIGFYKVQAGINIPAGRAYLATSNGVKGYVFSFADDTETGISEAMTSRPDAVVYNLAGQRLNKMQRGINIVNGKKVMY